MYPIDGALQRFQVVTICYMSCTLFYITTYIYSKESSNTVDEELAWG
jgi:hypothetical protein